VQASQRVILHGEAGSEMHSNVREAGCTWLWWIQGKICYFNCGGGEQNNNKSAPPVGLQQLNISFLYPNSIPWFIRVHGSCQANRESLSYPVIDF
jgi:hypothetical protein